MNKKAFLTTLPDFIEIQRASFFWFLDKGLTSELGKFTSINSVYSNIELNFFGHEYKIKKPKYNIRESKFRDTTYAIRLYIPMSIRYINKFDFIIRKKIKTYVFIGELPLMTNRGTFIINGCERVILNQIIRSPGVYYDKNNTYKATLIPNKGSWLKFEIEPKNFITIRVDNSDKITLLDFLHFFDLTLSDILLNFRHPEFLENDVLKEKNQGNILLVETQLELKNRITKKIFNSKYYNLGSIGRYKLNMRFNLNIPKSIKNLTIQDILTIVDELINLSYDESYFDDIDHLQNRRVRSVGELLKIQFNSGLIRLERNISEKLPVDNASIQKIKALINPKPLISIMREFFGSSQLSQFLDQTNPLAELTHRRRITGLGLGGFSRDHVSFAVRDIHSSHYGRLCPIETPEGQSAGLISSLSVYSRINSFGFIETPFFKVTNGQILNKYAPIYLTSEEEDQLKIAPADIPVDIKGYILKKYVTVRYKQEFIIILATKVELIGVSAIQIISSASSLIPFLEHNDANRSLMGSNMQRQAVPLLYPIKPIIGTGLETQLATDARMVLISYTSGFVSYVSSNFIHINDKIGKKIVYDLQKYVRSNQDTCINQRPIVWNGESIKSGQIIADGPGTESGEIALGQNITIAYMPWEGYNYEDALLINERLIYSDLFTSIHLKKYDLEVFETEIGIEKLTKNIPNIHEKEIKNLDKNGIIKKGQFVKSGDILVGKITPNEKENEIPEKLFLNTVYGNRNLSMIDNSLRVTNGSYGRVVDIRIFSRENGDVLPYLTHLIIRIFLAQIRKIQVGDKMSGRHGNKGIISKILSRQDMPYLPNGQPIDLILNPLGVPSRMNVGQLFEGLFGFAGDILNKRFKILPFDEIYGIEASRILINNFLIKAKKETKNNWLYNKHSPGKIMLTDGRTGELFENPITVCKSYILKLIHLVDDKIHARSTGPYSLITQQPLKGKSKKGGQRFGEMEVWALEAFGAVYTLQELLTLKSDDMSGRKKMLTSILEGKPFPKASIPESFKVLLLELKALGLDIELYKFRKNRIGETKEFKFNILEKEKNTIPIYESIEID